MDNYQSERVTNALCSAPPGDTAVSNVANKPFAACRKLVSQTLKIKQAILAEFRHTFQTRERLLHLALSEAEALAWQTAVPHLVFPTLAREKAQAVVQWETRQRAMRSMNSTTLLAA